jgi:hypothetical protein
MARGDIDDPTNWGSTVRNNLMKRPNYSPYCGNDDCVWHMPRTTFNDGQFECRCGWRSGFEPDFIKQYKARWGK